MTDTKAEIELLEEEIATIINDMRDEIEAGKHPLTFDVVGNILRVVRTATPSPAERAEALEDVEGRTPSSQNGGCDYMHFSDAQKLFQKYIDCEMRDPNGLDETAKAMLSYNRMVFALQQPPAPDLDKIAGKIEGLKRPTGIERHGQEQRDNKIHNSAIDAALELIKQAKS